LASAAWRQAIRLLVHLLSNRIACPGYAGPPIELGGYIGERSVEARQNRPGCVLPYWYSSSIDNHLFHPAGIFSKSLPKFNQKPTKIHFYLLFL
jgi:hypothetical protein